MSDAKKKAAATVVARIQANERALARCAGHNFNRVADSSLSPAIFGIAVFVKCEHCEGEIEAEASVWYERGLEHGRRRPARR